MAKSIVCLWYDHDAEEAASFYAATFPDTTVGRSPVRLATIPTARLVTR
jgi:predicted 3-demethylubiquinone-9 3-methyltransferase (glyoxalase superfamily)